MREKLLGAILALTVISASAQTCSQRLVQAERDYENGRLQSIPDNIGDCFGRRDGDFSKEERIRAYRLLTLVHIFTDNEPEAERSLISLLRVDPEHQLDERVDPAELRLLYNQFQTRPIFRIGFRAGINTSFPQVMDSFTASDANFDNKFYNGRGGVENQDAAGVRRIGFNGEVTYEQYFKAGLEGVAGLQVRASSYDVDNFFNDPFFNNNITNSQVYARLPIMARYTLNYDKRGGFQPYGLIGLSYDFLISARYVNATRRGGSQFTLADNVDLLASNQVNRHNASFIAGIGLRFPVQTHFLTAEFRYEKSFFNYIDEDNRYSNQSINFDLGHVEDNLRLDFLSLTIGYTLSIYNPKRLNN
ncbi:MAG: outer membrane beta-barrel protein [Bacteroidota bacterium]